MLTVGVCADEREQGKFVDLHRSIKVRSTYTTIIPEFFFFALLCLCYDSVNSRHATRFSNPSNLTFTPFRRILVLSVPRLKPYRIAPRI